MVPQGLKWSIAAYLIGLVVSLGVGACVWGIPLPVADFITFLFEFQEETLAQTFVKRWFATNYFRPLFFVQFHLQFDLSQGHYLLAFRGVQVLHLIAIVLLSLRVLRIRSAAGFIAGSMALMVLLGLHTIINGLREGPLTALLACAAAVNLSFAERSSHWRDAAAVLLLAYAAFSVELGLLVWVMYVAAWIVGCRGVSWRGVAASTAVVVAYLVVRFVLLDAGASDLLSRQIEGGAVGGRSPSFYVHNIAASALTVLFSEPRNGVWEFARRAAADELAPWLWINVITSALTTACIAWYVATRVGAWRRLTLTRRVVFTREDQLILVFVATLAANATLGFAYTRDVMMSPAGLLYAITAFVAFHALLNRAAAGGLPIRALAVTALLAISIGWSIRTVGLTYVLRETAFIRRNDWAMGIERLQRNNQLPDSDGARALAYKLRNDALTAHVPNHWLAQPGVDKYFDKAF